MTVRHQRIRIFNVSLDHQLKTNCFYSPEASVCSQIHNFGEAVISQIYFLVGPYIEEANDSCFLGDYHDRMYGREGDVRYFIFKDDSTLKGEFLDGPDVDCSVFTACCEGAVPCRCFSAGKFEVRIPEITYKLEFAF